MLLQILHWSAAVVGILAVVAFLYCGVGAYHDFTPADLSTADLLRLWLFPASADKNDLSARGWQYRKMQFGAICVAIVAGIIWGVTS